MRSSTSGQKCMKRWTFDFHILKLFKRTTKKVMDSMASLGSYLENMYI